MFEGFVRISNVLHPITDSIVLLLHDGFHLFIHDLISNVSKTGGVASRKDKQQE